MRWSLVIGIGLALAGCGAKPKQEVAKDTLTTRERQEAIGNSGIPGAIGINKALQAADTAAARVQALDTVGR